MKNARIITLLLALFMVVGMTACQSSPAPTASQSAAAVTTASAEATKASEAVTVTPEATATAPDAMAKYDPPITISIGRSTNSGIKFIAGENWENNIWHTKMLADLGIDMKFAFIVDGAEYESKVNMIIASGEMPDTMFVNMKQLNMLVEDNMLTDMTAIFDQYATDISKGIYSPEVFKAAHTGGKLMGVPMSGSTFDGTDIIWIRNDWLKKVGMEPPKTYQELKAIAQAFIDKDPDGNGAKDTFGFSVNKEPFGKYNSGSGLHELLGLAEAFHAYPNAWVKDADGKIVYGSTTAEMKATLKEAADLFAAGFFDPEFVVKDETKATEVVNSNHVGIIFGHCWAPFSGLGDHMKQNPSADWKPYALVSVDDKPAKPKSSLPVGNFAVINKDYAHPEAVMKMFNKLNQIYWGPLTDEQEKFLQVEYGDKYAGEGAMPFLYSYPYMEIPTINLISHQQMTKAVDADSLDVIDQIVAMNTEMTKQTWKYLKEKDIAYWWCKVIFVGPDSAQAIHQKNYDSNNVMLSEFYGAPTPTMIEKMSTMDQLQQEVFIKIITGSLPIDEFDKFVTKWYEIGGTDITKEVNDWYATK